MHQAIFYLALASLMLATPAFSYETITVGNFEAHLLAPGESAYVVGATQSEDGYTEGYRQTVTGGEEWTQDQIDTITRSLQTLDQSFATNSPSRKMQIAFCLEEGMYLGNSLGTLIVDQARENKVSTGELLLRDNIPINNILGSVDDVITIFTSVPLHYSPEAPDHRTYDFQATVTHEILHAMGIMNGNRSDGTYPNGITRWDSLLADSNGQTTSSNPPSITPTGELGTVFWTGEAANATYGGPILIQTFADQYWSGSALSHPVTPGELMYWQGFPLDIPRAPNKLLLDMYRDMGWEINDAYYDSFGPTYYGDDRSITNTDNFGTSHSYTYGMYVNGNNNSIEQNGELTTTKEQSNTLYVWGEENNIRVNGALTAKANYSHALYSFGVSNQIYIEREATLSAIGEGSVGILLYGYYNSIFHSGTTLASDGATAIRVDNQWADWGYWLHTSLHIQTGSEIVGDIINTDPDHPANITFGRQYGSDGSYSPDPDFSFTYNDQILGNWNHTVTAGKLSLGADAMIEGNMENYGTLAGYGSLVGHVTNYGIIAPGNSIGTLTISGELTQSTSSDLQIEFGNGDYDQLVVSGTAHLDGSLSLIPIGYLASGSYQFLDADAVTGTFATINNVSSSILQTSASSLSPRSFTLVRNSYASVTESQQQSIASSFDRTRPTASGDLAETLNHLDMMNQTDIRQAIDDFSPYFHNSATTALLENIRTRSTFLQHKINQNESERQSPLWVTGFGGNTHYNKEITSNDFKTQYSGIMLGFDKRFKTGLQLGIATSYTDLELNEKATISDATTEMYDGHLYGSWSPKSNEDFYLQSILGLGVTNSETDRSIAFLGRTATSDHDSTYYSAFIGGGYTQHNDNWTIEPRVGLEYINLDEDSFTEHGAQGAALSIHSKDSAALVSSVGFEMSHSCELSNGLLVPRFRADWFHNFSTQGENTVATLQNGETFHVEGREPSKDSLELAVGLTVRASNTLHGTLDYQYTFADNQNKGHLLSAGLRYNF